MPATFTLGLHSHRPDPFESTVHIRVLPYDGMLNTQSP